MLIGGDDYIQKPFKISELRARVMAHLRREKLTHVHSLRIGGVLLDMTSAQILVGGEVLNFTKSEFAISSFFMEHAGQVFSKEQIFESVFGFDKQSDESVITEHVKNIRAKLKQKGQTPIETVWGIGYRWKKEKV